MNRLLVISSFLVNFLILNLLFSLLFFGVILALRWIRLPMSSESRCHLLLNALALPPVLAYALLAASLFPPLLILEGRGLLFHLHISHPYHHLCLFQSPINLPSGLFFRGILISSLILIFFSLFRGLYSWWKLHRRLIWLAKHRTIWEEVAGLPPQTESLLREFREKAGLGIQLDLIKADFPVSFLSGIFHPQIFLSTGLLQALSPEQVRALLQHEIAHRLRLDNLSQLILSFCKNLLFISPTGHLLFRWWKQEAELLCDEIAIHHTGRPLDLAEALLKTQKAMMGAGRSRIQPISQSAFLHPVPSILIERRIRNILSLCDQDPARIQAPLCRFNPFLGLIAYGCLSFSLLFLLDTWVDPLFVHCQLERIIRFLV